MIPLILAVAAVALYVLPLVMPRPQEPDDIALPPLGPATPVQSGPPSFVEAVAAYDRLRSFVGPRQYPPDEAARISAALGALRLALVDPPMPDHFVGVSKMVETTA